MNAITSLKTVNDDFQIEYEVLLPIDISTLTDPSRREIALELQDINFQIDLCKEEIAKLSVEIDKFTNHADGLDYAVAVASGVLTGIIDSIFVGEIDIKTSTKEAESKVAEKVKQKALKEKQEEAVNKAVEGAKKKGKNLSKDEIENIKNRVKEKFYSDPNNLAETGKDPVIRRAIKYLEEKHPTPQDNLYKGTGSRPETHHLDDIAHHASLAGMIASIVVQFFRVATFVNKDGKWQLKFVKTDIKGIVEAWLPIIISGLLNWLVCIAEKEIEIKDGEKLPEPIIKIAHLLAGTPAIIQVIKAIDNWCLHLYSDVAGSSKSKGRGAGIPGLFISLLKELSSVPPLNFTGLPKAVEFLYANQKIDLRTEMGIAKELGRQSVPIIINEVLVRTFYFVRRLVLEYKEHGSFSEINWEKVIPFGNRTVERMMTIASGTFTAVDIADAAIRGAINSGGTWAGFAKEFILHINFVGIGRFAVAIGVDVGMGIKRSKLLNERIALYSEMLNLSNTKIFYLEADMWKEAENTEKAIQETYQSMEVAIAEFSNAWEEICAGSASRRAGVGLIRKKNKDFAQELLETTEWGI